MVRLKIRQVWQGDIQRQRRNHFGPASRRWYGLLHGVGGGELSFMKWAVEFSKLLAALVVVALQPIGAFAQPAQTGDILMPEATSGSVVNIAGGGDFTGVPRFATGLTFPVGVCQGPNGDIYVSERNSGEVTIITAGGDFTGATAFATGLNRPMALYCTPTKIFVSENFADDITDITAGGDFTGVAPYAEDIYAPAALLATTSGALLVASYWEGVVDITGGGDFGDAPFFAVNDLDPSNATSQLTQFGSRILVANEHSDQILDITPDGSFPLGGNFSDAPVHATIDLPIGLLAIRQTGQLLVAAEVADIVVDVAAGGDFLTNPVAFASGVDPEDIAQMVYVNRSCGDGVTQSGEQCDDGNADNTDACLTTCLDAGCGDGFVRAGVETCDDGDADNTDSCLTTCELASCGDGFCKRVSRRATTAMSMTVTHA